MSNINTGGPAFPQHVAPAYRQEPEIWGMTLRDYFAAKAMQGFVSDQNWRIHVAPMETARAAYALADAMIKVRSV